MATFVGPDGLPREIPVDPDKCVNGYDSYGVACTDWSTITNDPAATAAAINYLYTPSPKPPAPTVGISSITVIGGVVAVVLLLALVGGRR